VEYGNIGRSAVEAVHAAPDKELAGVIRRSSGQAIPTELANIPFVTDVAQLGKVDAVLLCGKTRSIPETAPIYLRQGIHPPGKL